MNIRQLQYFKFNSPLLRRILSLRFKEGHSYKIPFGALKGMRLYYRKDINFHASMGVWERESLQILSKLFSHFGLNRPNKVIADVGANIGYYSLFFSRYLDSSSKIFAFEPSSSILPVLRKNLQINNIENVQVLDLALSDHAGTTEFYVGKHHHQSSLLGDFAENAIKGTRVQVSTNTLDGFFEEFNDGSYPDLIKMDIEGGGIFALKGCEKCISEKRPFILMESHNPAEDNAVSHVLIKYDYEALRVINNRWVMHKDAGYNDRDGVWGTMLLIPAERKPDFIK